MSNNATSPNWIKFLKDRPLWVDLVLIALAVSCYFFFPYSLAFVTRILIVMIFVLSLDLVLGYAGVATLGHAALFGTGAYAAGLFALHVTASPILGLLVGACAASIIAFISGLLLMRAHGLTVLMLSIAFAEVLQEISNQAGSITSGADGLAGFVMNPILGVFEFDFIGQTGFWYALVVLIAVFAFLKIVVASPFGLAARGIHQSVVRMRAIGTGVYWKLVAIYTLSGAIAGIAGALSAQITELVSPEVFSTSFSAEAVIMLILGGMGRLYGAIIGTALFMVVHHTAASVDPFNWLFVIGGLVLVVVFFVPAGLLALPAEIKRRMGRST